MYSISAGMGLLRFSICFCIFLQTPPPQKQNKKTFPVHRKSALRHITNPQTEYRFSTQSITTSEFRICARFRPKAFLFWVRSINIASLARFLKQHGGWRRGGDFLPKFPERTRFTNPQLLPRNRKVEPLHGCQVAEGRLSIKKRYIWIDTLAVFQTKALHCHSALPSPRAHARLPPHPTNTLPTPPPPPPSPPLWNLCNILRI